MILVLFALLAEPASAGSTVAASTTLTYCKSTVTRCLTPVTKVGSYQETLPDDIMPIPEDVASRVVALMRTSSSLRFQAIEVSFENGQKVKALVVQPSGSSTAYFLAPATSSLWAVGSLSISGSSFRVASAEWITASSAKISATFR